MFCLRNVYVFLSCRIWCMIVAGIFVFAGSVSGQEVQNPCGEGYFMDSKGVCYNCATETSAPSVAFNETAQALCQMCGNRMVEQNTCRLSGCEAGRHFRDQAGACLACASTESAVVGSDREAQSLCRQCGNREVTPNGVCRLTRSACEKGFYDGNDNCFSCHYPHRVELGKNKLAYETCAACPNREIVGGSICQIKPTSCRRGQKFTDSKDSCYDCSVEERVNIGKNIMLQYACNACPNRFVTPAGDCVKAVCPVGQFMDGAGNCYPCDTQEEIAIDGQAVLEQMCLSCSNRTLDGSKCVLTNSQNRTNVDASLNLTGQAGAFTDMSGNTYDCSIPGGVPVGYVVSAKQSCLNCGNRFVSTINLCLPETCPAGQLMDVAGFCHSCDSEQGIFVGWGEERLEKMCLACGQRSISNGYCFRD